MRLLGGTGEPDGIAHTFSYWKIIILQKILRDTNLVKEGDNEALKMAKARWLKILDCSHIISSNKRNVSELHPVYVGIYTCPIFYALFDCMNMK